MCSRYEKQLLLPEVGTEGQRRLTASRVAVVGAGGLGSPVLYALVSAGIGFIRIVDSDAVEISNLNRQFLHVESDIGRAKSLSAKEKLERYNSAICVEAIAARLDEENARELLADCDLVVSCVDNKQARQLMNRVCVRENIALIDGGVQGFEGYVLTVLPGVTPCRACVFPNGKEDKSVGVLGAAAGVIGSLMAVEAFKHLVGIPIDSYFHYVDGLGFRLTPLKAEKLTDCPVCGDLR